MGWGEWPTPKNYVTENGLRTQARGLVLPGPLPLVASPALELRHNLERVSSVQSNALVEWL